MRDLFNEDLSKMDYKQLANWIIACRNVVQYDAYDNKDYFYDDLERFCLIWEEHYKNNIKLYQSEKYKRALVYIQCLNRASVSFLLKDKEFRIPMSDYLSMNNDLANQKSVTQEFEHCVSDEYAEIKKIFDDNLKSEYKKQLHKVVSKQLFTNIEINNRIFVNRKMLKASSFDELLQACRNNSNFEIRTSLHERCNDYNSALRDLGVNKTRYNEFTSERPCEKAFDKGLFINLSFALALTYSRAAKLLAYNGYSMNQSTRYFDIICRTAFLVGFNQNMTVSLIEKKNAEIISRGNFIATIPQLV